MAARRETMSADDLNSVNEVLRRWAEMLGMGMRSNLSCIRGVWKRFGGQSTIHWRPARMPALLCRPVLGNLPKKTMNVPSGPSRNCLSGVGPL